jgi:hypothetical protein
MSYRSFRYSFEACRTICPLRPEHLLPIASITPFRDYVPEIQLDPFMYISFGLHMRKNSKLT